MTVNRRKLLKSVGVAGVVGLAGCSGGPDDTGGDGNQTEEESDDGTEEESDDGTEEESDDGTEEESDDGTEEESDDGTEEESDDGTEEESTDIGMVYAAGGLGDGSFNDQAQQGLFDAEEDFDIAFQEAQPDEVPEFESFQQQFAQSTNPDYDLICCIGFLQTDALQNTSQSYSDQNFMIVDAVVEQPNVASYIFQEQEGSFLVGQLAGMMTSQDFSAGEAETNTDATTVGFVGGVESDLIRTFEAGFTAGVQEASEDVEVLTNYVGDFNDPAGGQSAANAMYNNGADVIYHASGNTGTGVFQAAQDQGRFAIGVDRDQSVTRPDFQNVIAASMIKRVDTAVYNSIEATVNGEFPGGEFVALGLEAEGVGVVYGQQIGESIPDEMKTTISDSRQAIIDGDISVPSDPDNV